jgi:hypothetical protein
LTKWIALSKIKIFILFFIITINGISQSANPLVVSGNVQFTNNGTAPVPLFALGRPAIMSNASFKKGNFYFNPELSFGMDLKPWMINTRYGYNLIDNNKWTIGLAATPSLFFLQRNPILSNNEEFQVQRYVGYEFNGLYKVTSNRKFQFQYWYSICLDKLGILNEDYISLAYAFENIPIAEKSYFSWRPNIFYLRDYKTLEGSFASQSINFQQKNWKVNLFVQTTIPIKVNPSSGFIWNTGINLPF